jgi:hypothetical protein
VKPLQTENPLFFTDTPIFWRRIGAGFLILAFASFLFAYFGAIYFGAGDVNSIIVYAVVSILFGLTFSFCGIMLIAAPDRKLEINLATGKIILTEKLFRTTTQEFKIGDVENIELVKRDLEDSSYYLPQILFCDGRIVEIPSENLSDEKRQMEIFEQVKNLLQK